MAEPDQWHSEAGDTVTRLILESLRTHGVLLAVSEQLIGDLELTPARWPVMGVLEYCGTATVSKIARLQGLQRQSVQRLVDALALEGLVEFVDNPDHRRAKLVRLTVRGARTYEKLLRRQIPWANALGADFSLKHLLLALRVLKRLRAKLEVQADGAELVEADDWAIRRRVRNAARAPRLRDGTGGP